MCLQIGLVPPYVFLLQPVQYGCQIPAMATELVVVFCTSHLCLKLEPSEVSWN